MAIGKKIYSSRRCVLAMVSPSGRMVVDSAVDVEKSDLKEYKKSLWDAAFLAFNPEDKPTWITIKPLTRRQKDAAENIEGIRERAGYYVRCALEKLENYQIETDGRCTEAPSPDMNGQPSSEKWLDELDLPEDQLIGIMLMIREISEAQLPFSQPSSRHVGDIARQGGETI